MLIWLCTLCLSYALNRFSWLMKSISIEENSGLILSLRTCSELDNNGFLFIDIDEYFVIKVGIQRLLMTWQAQKIKTWSWQYTVFLFLKGEKARVCWRRSVQFPEAVVRFSILLNDTDDEIAASLKLKAKADWEALTAKYCYIVTFMEFT